MGRICSLRYALVTSLLVAFLGLAASPIVYSDKVNAAEEKQVVKAKQRAKGERKHFKLKPAKKARTGKKIKKGWCYGWDCDDD